MEWKHHMGVGRGYWTRRAGYLVLTVHGLGGARPWFLTCAGAGLEAQPLACRDAPKVLEEAEGYVKARFREALSQLESEG